MNSRYSSPIPIAVMISGSGRTLINLAERIDDETLDASVEIVISSREDCPGVERARHHGFNVVTIPRHDFADESEMHDRIDELLHEAGVELICLAGYLRKVRIADWMADRIINIHPALLPEFGGEGMYGLHVHRAVLAAGKQVSGCTVHYVDDKYDHGPVILQRTCPVLPDDDEHTLAARVFEQECIAYPEAIRMIQQGEVRLVNGKVQRRQTPDSSLLR